MKKVLSKKVVLGIVALISVAIWTLLIWGHYHGGVPSHSFMARKDMPSISNWWGGFLLPLLTYFTLNRIQKRPQSSLQSVLPLFLFGMIYSASMAYFFTVGYEDLNGNLFIGLFILALILPIYRAEFYLGFVIGMTYTFGAVLSMFIGSIIVSLSFMAHRLVYPFVMGVGMK